MKWFYIDFIVFELLGYPMSLIELLGTATGLVTVWLASRSNILTWPTGLINVVLFFILFYQVSLYSDMLLQVYFFATSIYGWIYWYKQKKHSISKPISVLGAKLRVFLGITIILSTLALGYVMGHIHELLPSFFPSEAAFPYADAFTTILSIIANLLLAQRKVENWILWILVDVVSIILYTKKGILLVSIEYIIFLIISIVGLFHWTKLYRWS